jgi:hypothetical protein
MSLFETYASLYKKDLFLIFSLYIIFSKEYCILTQKEIDIPFEEGRRDKHARASLDAKRYKQLSVCLHQQLITTKELTIFCVNTNLHILFKILLPTFAFTNHANQSSGAHQFFIILRGVLFHLFISRD